MPRTYVNQELKLLFKCQKVPIQVGGRGCELVNCENVQVKAKNIELMLMIHYTPNRCLYIKVANTTM